MKYSNNIILNNLGITEEMKFVYLSMLDIGFSTASKLSEVTGFKKSYTYKILDLLEENKLVKKIKKNRQKTIYYPQSPNNILLASQKIGAKIEKDQTKINSDVSKMLSKFNMLEGESNVLLLEGVDGIKKLYKDIILEGGDIKLIRSPKDVSSEDFKKELIKQRSLQKENNINVRIVGPVIFDSKSKSLDFKKYDEDNLVERRILSSDKFSNDAQILIYSNKVAITSHNKLMSTILIENMATKETFDNIFELLWDLGKRAY